MLNVFNIYVDKKLGSISVSIDCEERVYHK
jgi:hypothetical protein